MKRKMSLVKQFSISSFIVISLLGAVLAITFSVFFEKTVLNVSAERTADLVNIIVSYSLRPEDFSQPMIGPRLDAFDTVIKENITNEEDMKLVKIWNAQGLIIYSNKTDLIGQRFPMESDLKTALAGKTVAEIASMEKPENQIDELDPSRRYIEVYVPIRDKASGQTLGVFEVYREADNIYEYIANGQKFGRFFIGISFLVLYLSLYQIVKRAAKTIEEQNVAIRRLTSRLDETMAAQEAIHVGTIKALMSALDAKDHYTAGHCMRVTDYALLLGRAVNLPQERLDLLEEAALFHDIGKIGIPEQILNKKDSLTTEEFEEMKKHPVIGAEIIASTRVFAEHAELVRHHHERYDGRGYPDGLKGEEIPIEARIMAIADTYDAMTSDRPYRSRMSKEKAINILLDCRGTQFDPQLVDVFVELIR
ncbi:HD-GYP domain-containing protein [Carboxydocella sp. JDF658]|uniref:HD-GYP domain-containing protein n=1 Tax=Carboxydocella sp. JDF658 TaxID=1926600 RepID=UPI0009C6B4D8|nr:HD-GYP domain-containing protein [Carboxydocella sp. JDF658]GAW30520.1 carbon-monoxide dehydrogenase catalytic subunit [Carboxydocella sp. JDF658]